MELLLVYVVLGIPFLAFVPFFTPPEWWFDIHDMSTHSGRSASTILWLEMRLGHW